MKNSFVVTEEIVDDTLILWIAYVLLLFSLKGQVGRSEKEYAFQQYMDCPRPSDVIDKELGCVCLRCCTADGIDHSRRKDDSKDFLVLTGLGWGD